MGRWDATYSDDQRALITEWIVDEGLTGPAAAARAQAGGDTFEPFNISRGYASRLAQEERQRRDWISIGQGDDTPLRERLYKLADKELRKLERQQQSGKSIDVTRLKNLIVAIKEIGQLKAPTHLGDQTPQEPAGPLAQLLNEATEDASKGDTSLPVSVPASDPSVSSGPRSASARRRVAA